MKGKTFTLLVAACFILLAFLPLTTGAGKITSLQTIYVDDDNRQGPWDGSLNHPYQHIQDALNVSLDGYTVFVFNGIYYENLEIDKSIHLIGENKESCYIIDDFSGSSSALTINKNHVIISNLTINGIANAYSIYIKSDYTNVYDNNIMSSDLSVHSNYNTISHNFFNVSDFYAIRLEFSSFNYVFENTLVSKDLSGHGILLNGGVNNQIIKNNITTGGFSSIDLDSCGNIIADNEMTGGGINYLLDSTHNNNIFNNSVNGKSLCYVQDESHKLLNQEYGQAILVNCNNITIEHQNISIWRGIHLHSSEHCVIKNSYLSNLLMIEQCTNVNISRNIIDNGLIDIRYSDYTEITGNLIKNSSTGIDFLGWCNDSKIIKNSFVNISKEISGDLCSNFLITKNNFYDFKQGKIFTSDFFSLSSLPFQKHQWKNNYWGKMKIFPKPIFVFTITHADVYPFCGFIPWIAFDWHPAKQPYDIDGDGDFQ